MTRVRRTLVEISPKNRKPVIHREIRRDSINTFAVEFALWYAAFRFGDILISDQSKTPP